MSFHSRTISTLLLISALTGTAVIAVSHTGAAMSSLQTAVRGSSLVVGRVVDADTGRPIAGAVATLNSPSLMVDRVRCAEDGTFVFRFVPAGRYTVGAVHAYYRGSSNDATRLQITVGEGTRHGNLTVKLRRFSSISGVVRDDRGDPVAGVQVRRFSRQSGVRAWSVGTTATTDDRGIYRFGGIAAGAHVIIGIVSAFVTTSAGTSGGVMTGLPSSYADALPAGVLDVGGAVQLLGFSSGPTRLRAVGHATGVATTFYPNSDTTAGAEVLRFPSARDLTGIDLRVRREPLLRITGRLDLPENVQSGTLGLDLIRRDDDGLVEIARARAFTTRAGEFTMFAPPGEYELRMRHRPSPVASTPQTTVDTGSEQIAFGSATTASVGGPPLWVSQALSVTDAPISDLVVPVRTGLRLRGRVVYEGSAPRPTTEQWQRAPIHIWGLGGARVYSSARLSPNGEFVVEDLPAGRYLLRTTPPAPWVMRGAISGDLDVSDVPLTMNGDVEGVVITVVDRSSRVLGLVRDEDGAPAQNVSVAMLPASRALMVDEASAIRRQRAVRSDASGRFDVTGMPAGDYLLLALDEDSLDVLGDPQSFDRIASVAARVTITEGDVKTQDLRLVRVVPDSRPAASRRHPAAEEVVAATHRGEPVETARSRVGSTRVGAVVEGHVVTNDPSRRPIADALVTLSDAAGQTSTVFADDEGRFVFEQVAPGRFRVQVSKAAFLATEYGASRPGRPGVSFPVAAGARVEITVPLARGSVIAGTVTDESGEPLGGVEVRALAVVQQGGVQRVTDAKGAMPEAAITDERGRYRIFNLEPGRYVVGVTPGILGAAHPGRLISAAEAREARGAVSATGPLPAGTIPDPRYPLPSNGDAGRVVLGPTFGLASTTLDGATVIELGASDERLDGDIRMRLLPAVNIAGQVMAPDAAPARGARVTIFPAGPYVPATHWNASMNGVGGSLGGAAAVTATSDGRFVVGALTPGRYTVIARGSGSDHAWANQELAIGTADVGGLTIALRPALTVRGRVVFPGTPPAFDMTRLRVRLSPLASVGPTVTVAPAGVDAEGRFNLTGLVPGRYWLEVTGSPAGWRPATAMVGAADALDVPLEITADPPVEVVVSMTEAVSRLSGTFMNAAGRPASEYFVIAFPDDPRLRWSKSRRIVAVRPSTDGRYEILGLPPGRYRLAAVSDVAPDEWLDADYLESLVPASLVLDLAAGQSRTLDIGVAGARFPR